MQRHKLRNLVACSPLLRKGGAHVQSKSGQRQKDKNKLKQEVKDWKLSKNFEILKEQGNQTITLFLCLLGL
jgi:hypothetical protein